MTEAAPREAGDKKLSEQASHEWESRERVWQEEDEEGRKERIDRYL